MSKTLFQELNDQFQSGEGFVVAKFEVKGQNENNLELELNGTRYNVSGDAILPIDAPVNLVGLPDENVKCDAQGNTELHPVRASSEENLAVSSDKTYAGTASVCATTAADQLTSANVELAGSVTVNDAGETVFHDTQVDASQGGSDVVLSDGNATEASAVADGNSAPAAAEAEHTAADLAAPLAPATEGDVLPEVSGHVPANLADQQLIDDMVATVLTHFGAHDLDPTGEEKYGATVFVLKDVAGEEVARGTLSALHEKATAPVAPAAE